MSFDDGSRLVISGPLASWKVILGSGGVVMLAAHSFAEVDDFFVFSILVEGSPPALIELARFPKPSVSRILSV
jgi:hypothetical protein